MNKKVAIALLLAAPAAAYALSDDTGEWISLFDGKSLDGWRAEGNKKAFAAENGQIVAKGELVDPNRERALLYYVGPTRNADFKNFELSLEAMTRPRAASSTSGSGWRSTWRRR